jgi:hypothetical protein
MARAKLTARKHVRTPPYRNAVPTESHSDGQRAGYFPRTLRTLLLALGYSEPPIFVGVSRLLCGNSYRQHQSDSSSRPRVATSSVGPVFRPAQPQFQPRPQAAG